MALATPDPSVGQGRTEPRGRHGRAIALAALAGLAGLGIGRFVTFDGGGGPPPAAIVGASTPEAQLASLERAVEQRPDDATAWQGLGTTYVRLAIATGNPDYFTGAERALARATELDPASPVTMVAKGTFALTLHQFDDALGLGQEAQRIDPFSPEARAVVVDALVELGRYDEAVAELQELLELRPGLAALTRVSYLRQLTGDLDGALTAMQQAESAAPQGFEHGVAAALRGEIQLLRGDLDAAGAAFDDALRRSPGLVAGELGRARHLEATGQRREAISSLQSAFEVSGAPALATLLGEHFEAEGRLAEAATAYQEARQVYLDEVDAGAIVDLEVAYLEGDHGDPALALEAARRAYAERPGTYTADAMAWTLLRNGQAAEALPYAEESLDMRNTDPALRVHVAAVYEANDRHDLAREALAPVIDRGGYLTPSLRPAVAEVAQSLDLRLPSHWIANLSSS